MFSQMSAQEEEVLNYVSGYIPFAMQKHYKKWWTMLAHKSLWIYCQHGQQMVHTKDSLLFLSTPQNGLEAQNRGCLFQPNAQLYLFFHACKNETRKHLNTAIIGSYRDINLNELLFKK